MYESNRNHWKCNDVQVKISLRELEMRTVTFLRTRFHLIKMIIVQLFNAFNLTHLNIINYTADIYLERIHEIESML